MNNVRLYFALVRRSNDAKAGPGAAAYDRGKYGIEIKLFISLM